MAPLESDVLDAARYLRSVRPIDPAELVAYTEAAATPSAIRAVLREWASDLALVERSDGTFAPPSTEPIAAIGEPIDRLPTDREAFLESQLDEHRGGGWADGEAAKRFREQLRDLKARYLDGGAVSYDADDADAYLLYHFPRSYAATRYVLDALFEAGLHDHHLRVLDVGAGVGAHLAAVDDATPSDALVEYVAVEPSPLSVHLEALAGDGVDRNTHVTHHDAHFEAVELADAFDLVVLGSVLSEVASPRALARKALEHVAPDGSWLAIAPADARTSTQLRDIERELEGDAGIFAPTLRLWPDRRPSDTCWSFIEQPPLAVPRVQRRLAAGADDGDAIINSAVRYSYSVLRPDGARRYDVTASGASVLPLADVADAVGERVDAIAVKLSGDLADDGNAVYRIGDGSQSVPCFAVLVAPSVLNRPLETAPYGAVVHLHNALVLWNDDEGAANLVVDDEVEVAVVAPERSA